MQPSSKLNEERSTFGEEIMYQELSICKQTVYLGLDTPGSSATKVPDESWFEPIKSERSFFLHNYHDQTKKNQFPETKVKKNKARFEVIITLLVLVSGVIDISTAM